MISPITALGLAALYCASFLFPYVRPQGAYLQGEILRALILPTLLAFISVVVFTHQVGNVMVKNIEKITNTRKPLASLFTRLFLSLFLLFAFRGLIAAAGYSLESIVISLVPSNASLTMIRVFKAAVLIVLISTLFGYLHFLTWPNGAQRLFRSASALGFSLAALIVADASQLVALNPVRLNSADEPQVVAPRRVVWIIFDELDYQLTFGKEAQSLNTNLLNFSLLAKHGVSANQAYSPTDSTISSIPALLMGLQPKSNVFLGPANQNLTTANGHTKQFNESNTVMGRLRQQGLQYSVLGFYHPYCAIFINAATCESYPYQNTEWHVTLTDWVPRILLDPISGGHIMERIAIKQSKDLPKYLGRTNDSLTYIHLNIPHLPAHFAFKHFAQHPANDAYRQYAANLRLADETLGKILQNLKQLSTQQEILLVVSSDHGFRTAKKSPDEARPVPWLAWRVNGQGGNQVEQTEQAGQAVVYPISTVHTAALIEDFLYGNVNSQSQIAEWWQNKPVLARLTAPQTHVDD